MTDEPIPFLQYLRPDGRQTETFISRPAEIAAKAQAIRAAGFVLESEVLTTGQASFTISDDDGDYAVEICSNGPDVLAAVDRLIMNFDIAAGIKDRDDMVSYYLDDDEEDRP